MKARQYPVSRDIAENGNHALFLMVCKLLCMQLLHQSHLFWQQLHRSCHFVCFITDCSDLQYSGQVCLWEICQSVALSSLFVHVMIGLQAADIEIANLDRQICLPPPPPPHQTKAGVAAATMQWHIDGPENDWPLRPSYSHKHQYQWQSQ